MADEDALEPFLSYHGDQPVMNYHQCMNCDTMLSGPDKGQVPADVERIGPPLPEGISPHQANVIEYGPEGGKYQSNGTPEAREKANVSHVICKDCRKQHEDWIARRRRELDEQRERERKAEARRQRRFRRGRKDEQQ